MKIQIQRLRNLTTGRLHTEMGHIYEDLENIVGEKGIMTHMIPRMATAVEPWLKKYVTEARMWEDVYDPNHVGEMEIPKPTQEERNDIVQRYYDQPSPFLK